MVQWQATSLSEKNRGDVDGDILTVEIQSVHLNQKLKTEKRTRETPPLRTVDLSTEVNSPLTPRGSKLLSIYKRTATRGGVCEKFKRSKRIVDTTY